jgi:hypothetical protein
MATRRKRDFPARRALTLGLIAVLAGSLVISACCGHISIKLGRLEGFLSGVFELSLEIQIDGFISSEFSGDLSLLGEWAWIPSFDGAEVETDVTGAVFTRAIIEYDVDKDASKERISVLRAEGGSVGGAPLDFFIWNGDAWTADKDVCYLGWYEGNEAKIAASYCGETTGVMICYMSGTSTTTVFCDACDTDGFCEPCSLKESLDKCLPNKADGGGSIDLDIDIDIDIDLDMDVDLEP